MVLPTGFSAYAIFIVVWVLAVYVPLCHWIWGGGWIAEMGAKDLDVAGRGGGGGLQTSPANF